MLKFSTPAEYLLKKEVAHYRGWCFVFCGVIFIQACLTFWLDQRIDMLAHGLDAAIASTVQE